MQEIDELLQAISALESQRSVLGDRVVEAALAPLREKLAALEGHQPVSQQRRLVTVLFADIVNSTLISQGLEPEEVMEIMDGALKRLSAPVEAYGGQVTRFMGDGFLAVFGLTRIHENDARQAVRAGLAILSESRTYAKELDQRFQVLGFSTRIGINTGWVAAGGFSEAESTIMGLTVSLASRLEKATQPDALFITQYTYQHVRGAFEVESLPAIEAKGFPQPIMSYKVLAARPRTFRTVTRGVEGIDTSLIGREAELCRLQEALTQTIQNKEPQLVTITGEAGVGKSRLLYEFDRWVAQAPTRIIAFKARASPQTIAVPYGLLRDMISYRQAILTTDPVDITRQRIIETVSEYVEDEPEMKAHFMGSLLGFDFSGSRFLVGVKDDPKQLRERGQLYLLQYMAAVARQAPTILMLDDIHWADDPSLSFLSKLIRECPRLPLFVVCLARPSLKERFHNWGEFELTSDQPGAPSLAPGYLRMNLGPLTRQSSMELLDEILCNVEALPDSLRDQLLNNADGNPYYLEEFIQALVDVKAIHKGEPGEHWKLDLERLLRIEIPSTLIALLEARLDSLNAAQRRLVQQASVIGPVFWKSALQAVRGEEIIPDAELEAISGRGFFYPQEVSTFTGTDEYRFHHGLLRDVAYQTLLKSERHQYHRQVADWLINTTQSSGRVGEYAPIIAEHYEAAGEQVLAADWFTEAGVRARNQGAPDQARIFFDRALAFLPSEASQSSGDEDLRRRWRALAGRDEVLGILGDSEARTADDIALVALAESIGDDRLVAEAYYRQGYYFGTRGQCQQELEAYTRGLEAALRANDHKREALILGLKVICEARLGQLEAADRTALTALQCAEEVGDDEVLARTLTNISALYTQTGDIARTAQLLNRQLSIIRRIGNLDGEVIGLSNLGYTYILLGMFNEAISTLQRCTKIASEIGHRRFLAYGSINLALAYLRSGNPDLALAQLEQCLPEFQAMDDIFDLAAGQTYAAMAREQIGQITEALSGYELAAGKLVEIGTLDYAYDAKAGIARCQLALNNLEAAQQYASQLWDYLQQGRIVMEFPILGFETCANVFSATGQASLARRIIEAGYSELMTRAQRISLPDWRQSFLESMPEHQRIQARWQEYTH